MTSNTKFTGGPAGHRILIKMADETCVSPGGIYLGKKDESTLTKGTVVQIGRNCYIGSGDEHCWCEVGDEILMVKNAGRLMTTDDLGDAVKTGTYRIINDIDVIYNLSQVM
jgi:co-chaperonin GroES (HSP10)